MKPRRTQSVPVSVIDVTSQRTYSVNLGPEDTVFNMKVKVSKVSGIPTERQKLIFAGRVLNDDLQVASYNLAGQTSITLFVKGASEKKKPVQQKQPTSTKKVAPVSSSFQKKKKGTGGQKKGRGKQIGTVFILRDGESSINLEFFEGMSVGDAKRDVGARVKASPDTIQFYYNGKTLRDENLMTEYELEDFSDIRMTVSKPEASPTEVPRTPSANLTPQGQRMGSVSIQVQSGGSVAIKLFKGDKVRDVKRRLESRVNRRSEEMLLVFAGRELKDEQDVASYEMANATSVNLTFRKVDPVPAPTPAPAPAPTPAPVVVRAPVPAPAREPIVQPRTGGGGRTALFEKNTRNRIPVDPNPQPNPRRSAPRRREMEEEEEDGNRPGNVVNKGTLPPSSKSPAAGSSKVLDVGFEFMYLDSPYFLDLANGKVRDRVRTGEYVPEETGGEEDSDSEVAEKQPLRTENVQKTFVLCGDSVKNPFLKGLMEFYGHEYELAKPGKKKKDERLYVDTFISKRKKIDLYVQTMGATTAEMHTGSRNCGMFKKGDVCVVCFAMDDADNFSGVRTWVKGITEYTNKKVVLLGCRSKQGEHRVPLGSITKFMKSSKGKNVVDLCMVDVQKNMYNVGDFLPRVFDVVMSPGNSFDSRRKKYSMVGVDKDERVEDMEETHKLLNRRQMDVHGKFFSQWGALKRQIIALLSLPGSTKKEVKVDPNLLGRTKLDKLDIKQQGKMEDHLSKLLASYSKIKNEGNNYQDDQSTWKLLLLIKHTYFNSFSEFHRILHKKRPGMLSLTKYAWYLGQLDDSGRPHGLGKEMHPNGNLKYYGEFKAGKKHGCGVAFQEDGQTVAVRETTGSVQMGLWEGDLFVEHYRWDDDEEEDDDEQ